ncbi:unnamed protein product [Rotaria sp. Silwood1]|nr:unnamed protein product [Rotaria sp. Silwood1]
MNSLLSTSLKQNVADIYTTKSDCDNEVNVLFEIIADPKFPGSVKPFANISKLSHFNQEEEVLFMAGSIFYIVDVINEDSFSTVKMKLHSKEENDLNSFFERLCKEYGGEQAGKEKEASLNSLGTILYNMKRYDITDRFFRRIYYETCSDDSNHTGCCLNIGNVAFHTD